MIHLMKRVTSFTIATRTATTRAGPIIMSDASLQLPVIRENWTIARILPAGLPVRPARSGSRNRAELVPARLTPAVKGIEATEPVATRRLSSSTSIVSEESAAARRLPPPDASDTSSEMIRFAAMRYKRHTDHLIRGISGVFLETWA
jgi:hypothetical protein